MTQHMKHFALLIISTLVAINSYSQKTQPKIKLLNGQLISKKDSTKMIGVHVVNISTNQATNSIEDGFFTIPYTPGDTILLTSIGYKDHFLYTGMFWVPSGQLISIFMSEKIYDLPEFDVNQYNSKEEFREDFKNQEPGKPVNNELFQYKGPSTLEDVETDLNAHVKLGSPITWLYSKVGREARQAKRLNKAKEQENNARIIEEKYNPAVVQRILELESKTEAQKFMEECPLEDEFILKAKEYDIVKAVLDCQKNQAGTNNDQ